MGLEPYSLAIIFAENMGHFASKNLRVDATDIDKSNLFGKIIADGIYPEEQVKRIPKEIEYLFNQVTNDGQLFRKVEGRMSNVKCRRLNV